MSRKKALKTKKKPELAREIYSKLKKDPELLEELYLLIEKEKIIQKKQEDILLPVSIFKESITPLESSVKYLKENLNLSYTEIASLLKRDQRNIWQAYSLTKKKLSSRFLVHESEFNIPLLALSNPRFSALESISSYLKDSHCLTYHEIAVLLNRDDRTIWTCYNRAKEKRRDDVS
jgi:hypothetical protein